jgi:hypothetical protein
MTELDTARQTVFADVNRTVAAFVFADEILVVIEQVHDVRLAVVLQAIGAYKGLVQIQRFAWARDDVAGVLRIIGNFGGRWVVVNAVAHHARPLAL